MVNALIREWLRQAPRVLTVCFIYLLIVLAYALPAWLADIGGLIVGPPIVLDGLRAFIVVHVGIALWRRWSEFAPGQRLAWILAAIGLGLNMASGHFADAPAPLALVVYDLGLIGATWRLMHSTPREAKLQRENEALREEAQHHLAARLLAERELDRLKGES